MNRCRALIVFLIAMLLVAPAVAHQLDPDQPLDMQLLEADLLKVLDIFATLQGLDLDAPGGLEGTVTIDLENTPWSEALRQVCTEQRLICAPAPPRLLVREIGAGQDPPEPLDAEDEQAITIAVRQASLHQILTTFGRLIALPVALEDGLPDPPITVSLSAVPWPLAMEEVCRLGGCQLSVEDDRLFVSALPASVLRARQIDLSLDATPLGAVLDSFRGLPIWGGSLHLEVEPGGADRPVTVDVRNGSWADLLNAACAEAACEWTLAFDQDGVRTLRVTFVDGRLDTPRQLAAFDGTLADAAKQLGPIIELPIQLVAGLEGDETVAWQAGPARGTSVLDALCAQAGCRWHLRGSGVQIAPRNPTLQSQPSHGLRGPAFDATLQVGNRMPIADPVRFTWAYPIQRVGSPDGWQAVWVWLPFADARQLLLPLAVDCGRAAPAAGTGVRVMEPIALPIQQAWEGADGEIGLGLTPRNGERLAERTALACDLEVTAKVTVHVPSLGRQHLHLPGAPGRHLLVSTPGTPGQRPSGPTAALVSLGDDGTFAHLAVVTLGGDGNAHVRQVAVGSNRQAIEVDGLTLNLRRTGP